MSQMSIFSLEELPANHSQSQDLEKDWMTLVATSCLPILPLLANIAPDGPRYKALGNSMAVPVMRWIGERIKQYEEMA